MGGLVGNGMKLGADNCLKFTKLKAALGWPKWQVIGLLESLWLLTAQNAPQGDIGKHSDEDLAAGLELDRAEFGVVLAALIDARWVDRHPAHRLVVHGWAEHMPDMIRKRLVRSGLEPISDGAADNGGQRQPVADNGSQRLPTAASREDRIEQDGIGLGSNRIGEGGLGETRPPTVYGTPEPPSFRKAVCDRWDAARAAGVPVGPRGPACVRLIPTTLDEIANCAELDEAARADPPGFLLRQLDAYLSSREAKQAPLNRLGTFLRKPDGRRKWLETPEQWNHQRDAVKPEPEETVHDRIARQIERVANAKQ